MCFGVFLDFIFYFMWYLQYIASTGCPKKYRCLMNNRTKVLSSVSRISSIFNEEYLSLNVKTKIVGIRTELSEIYYF